MGIRDFMHTHYRHFNARETRAAAEAWVEHVNGGGKMLVTLAGAMSTAELGISLSRLIRENKVHGICCTGANLEEDIFNLVAHDEYKALPNYRDLTPEQEEALYKGGWNRVTDVCIPEQVMRSIDNAILELHRHRAEILDIPLDVLREEVVAGDRRHLDRTPARQPETEAHGVDAEVEELPLGVDEREPLGRGLLLSHGSFRRSACTSLGEQHVGMDGPQLPDSPRIDALHGRHRPREAGVAVHLVVDAAFPDSVAYRPPRLDAARQRLVEKQRLPGAGAGDRRIAPVLDGRTHADDVDTRQR